MNKLNNKLPINEVIIDIILLLGLFFAPLLAYKLSFLSIVDELVLVIMIIQIIIRCLQENKLILLFPVTLSIFLIYSLFLIFKNGIPISHIAQIVLTLKFFIVFLYFYSKKNDYKKRFFLIFSDFLITLFLLSLLFSMLQLFFPGTIGEINPDGRGIRGVTAGGIFFSRILYSEFLLLFLVCTLTIKNSWGKLSNFILQNRYKVVIVTLVFLLLTYSRKELGISFMLLYYLIIDKVTERSKWLFSIILIGFLLVSSFFVWQLFADINASTFTNKQIRLIILLNAINIIVYYFPFGSGPGTFGSVMSLNYNAVYDKFNVPNAVVGYGGHRGPIFDLFFVSLTAEYGLGILLFIMMIFYMVRTTTFSTIQHFFNIKKMRVSLFFSMFVISFFVPIFSNTIGYMIFIIFALISQREGKIDS